MRPINTIAMHKLFLNWKAIRALSVRGTEFNCELPAIIDLSCRGTLLPQILKMEKKEPISFEDAIHLARLEHRILFKLHAFKRMKWVEKNFVHWISEQGYHIEITGDEFEPTQVTDKVC